MMTLSGLLKRLINEGLLSIDEAMHAQAQATREGVSLITYLRHHQILESAVINQLVGEEFGLPLFDLTVLDVDEAVTRLVDEALIHKFNALPIFKRGNKLFVAIADPANLQAVDQFQFHSGLLTEAILVEGHQLDQVIEQALDTRAANLADLTDADLEALEFDGIDTEAQTAAESEVDDAPLVRFVNKVLLDAINMGASDIHFEPYEQQFRVRCRADGLLQEIVAPPSNLAPRIAARLKVMARLNIAERRVPQDGRIKLKLSRNQAIDFRVSTCPTLFGEKVVLRILDSSHVKFGIDSLGYNEVQRKIFLNAVHKPQGMVLVTGPTGSGKTVSLYTALNILNTQNRNISSIEDPAEIYLPGINQVNVNERIGLTFAMALRAFLRQDPDVIMVGEIRDAETAEIAIKAAQTGHMVLSTLHTNDAPQTLSRLLNMGIEPYNIVSAVTLIIAQRLIRCLCAKCKQPVDLPNDVLLAQGFSASDIEQYTVFGPVGCQACNHGYRGRIGIFQTMVISPEMARIIIEGGNAVMLAEQAEREEIDDLRQSGLQKVLQGITSLEEVNRVTVE